MKRHEIHKYPVWGGQLKEIKPTLSNAKYISIMASMRGEKMKQGFTLAEVLITLGIIGIVAALTIPSLITKNQNKETITRLQKANSMLANAVNLMKADTGCSDLECLGFYGYGSETAWNDRMELLVKKYFKTVKINRADTERDGYANYFLSGTQVLNNFDKTGFFNFHTVDGMNFSIGDISLAEGGIGNDKALAVFLAVDTNGDKKPNTYGKDMFVFNILNDLRVVPYRGEAYAQYAGGNIWNKPGMCFYWNNVGGCENSCGIFGSKDMPANVDGQACAARIIENNWEIDY